MSNRLSPRQIFITRLWSFLNYRTTLRLTWLELLTASLVGVMLAWIGLRDWIGIEVIGPLSFYLLLFGFYREWHIPVGWVRALYDWLFKPLKVKPEPNKKYYAIGLLALCVAGVLLLWLFDLRVALLAGIALLVVVLLFWLIDEEETAGGRFRAHTVAGRIPMREIREDGTVVNRDGSGSKVAIITQGRSGYKPALKAVDVSEILTKFLAFLAQHEEGGQPIRLFWLTDYHLGQLDLGEADRVPPEYLDELRRLTESGARKARVVISGIVYPAPLEERIREWLGQLDLGVSPLGAYAVESLYRMLFGGESFLGQIQEASLYDGGGLPGAAFRGYLPEALSFNSQMQT
ncbi:MAG: hypothetical protein ACM3JD_01785 [Rudaea sp.]